MWHGGAAKTAVVLFGQQATRVKSRHYRAIGNLGAVSSITAAPNKHPIGFTLTGRKPSGVMVGATKQKLHGGKALKIVPYIELVGDTDATVNLY